MPATAGVTVAVAEKSEAAGRRSAPGRFVVSVAPEKEEEFRKLFAGQAALPLGHTAPDMIRFQRHGLVLLDVPVRNARKAWRGEK